MSDIKQKYGRYTKTQLLDIIQQMELGLENNRPKVNETMIKEMKDFQDYLSRLESIEKLEASHKVEIKEYQVRQNILIGVIVLCVFIWVL